MKDKSDELEIFLKQVNMTDKLERGLDPKSRCETRDKGRIWDMIRGPYYQHNQLVRHAEKLKRDNTEEGPRYVRLLPLGGGYNVLTDGAVFIIWLLVAAFPFVTIGTACYCQNVVNIIIAVILAVFIVWHVLSMWIISKNWKKLKRLWYVTKVDMKNHFGMQNRLTDVTVENLNQTDSICKIQKQTILRKLNTEKRESGKVRLMTVTDSYWKTRVLDPIILLSVVAVLCLVSIILQIEFYRSDGVS